MSSTLLALALLTPGAWATTYGPDYDFGAGPFVLVDGDVVFGSIHGTGRFEIPQGAVVTVLGAVSIQADTIAIAGTLDAEGAGEAGGVSLQDSSGTPGQGPGGGVGGYPGTYVHGGGGAGGSHRGAGGQGGYLYNWPGPAVVSGPTYGVSNDATAELGSGGGGAGSGVTPYGFPGGDGGAGGGGILLDAATVTIDGLVSAAGADGEDAGNDSGGGGGGGSGGSVVVFADVLTGGGVVDVSGGDGGDGPGYDPYYYPTGGGGGGGGRVGFVVTDDRSELALVEQGGVAGYTGPGTHVHVPTDGAPGLRGSDRDGDGVDDVDDVCPDDYDPLQEDLDADGIGDACDPDADGDGVDDKSDNCLRLYNPTQANNDFDAFGDDCDDDDDNDGFVDGSDACPFDYDYAASDNDGDGLWDSCDPDDDDDTFPDWTDACPWDAEDGGFVGFGEASDPVDGCPDFCLDPLLDVEVDWHQASNPLSGEWVYGRIPNGVFRRFTTKLASGAPDWLRHWRNGPGLSDVPRVIDAYKRARQVDVPVVKNGTTYPVDALVLQPGIGNPVAVRLQDSSWSSGRLVTVTWSMESARTSLPGADVEVWVSVNGYRDLDDDGFDDAWLLTGLTGDGAATTGEQQFTFLTTGADVIDFVVDAHGGIHTNFDLVSLRVSADDTCPYTDFGEG